MKLLYLVSDLEGKDGYSTYARHIVSSLRRRGHTVIVVCQSDRTGDYAFLPDHLQLLAKPWLLLYYGLRLRRIAQREQPDCIHSTIETYTMACAFLPRKYQQRLVATLHGTYAVRTLMHLPTQWCWRRLLPQIGRLIAVSNYTLQRSRQVASHALPVAAAKIFSDKSLCIRNGLQLPDPLPAPAEPSRTVLHVGGIKDRKGVLEALQGCKAYLDKYQQKLSVRIVGNRYEDSDYYTKVTEYIATNQLESIVTLVGRVSESELQQEYDQAGVFLMPANTYLDNFEGFGLVFLEAGVYGLPCIGPDDSGAAEAINNGQSGFQVNPKNSEAIADALHAVLDEHAISSSACQDWVRQNDIEQRVSELETVLKALASG